MALLNGFDSESGERCFVFGASQKDQTRAFFEDVYARPEGKRYLREFSSEGNKLAAVDEVYDRYRERGFVTVSAFCDVLSDLMNAGMDFQPTAKPAVETPAPVEKVPMDRNGKPLGAPQLRWREFAQWSETASSAQIKERAKADASFRAFLQSSLRLEMNEGIVPSETDGARPEVTPELREFAADYQRLPSPEVRRLLRADANPLGYQQFRRDRDAAIAAGLL